MNGLRGEWRWVVDWCGLRVVRSRYGNSQKFGLYDVDGDGFVDLRELHAAMVSARDAQCIGFSGDWSGLLL